MIACVAGAIFFTIEQAIDSWPYYCDRFWISRCFN